MNAPARQYTPVLRWKAGERDALANITSECATTFCPIIEPTPKAFRSAMESVQAFNGVLRKTARDIGQSWGKRVDGH